ncbi:MAG: hypothetical protein MR002_05005, partial [Acholeplasmatales bacterium]|nr:hypothetical protein [Acholeplasmatales bacterium]
HNILRRYNYINSLQKKKYGKIYLSIVGSVCIYINDNTFDNFDIDYHYNIFMKELLKRRGIE